MFSLELLQEGEAVTFLTVISSGKCIVTKTVPMISTSAKVGLLLWTSFYLFI